MFAARRICEEDLPYLSQKQLGQLGIRLPLKEKNRDDTIWSRFWDWWKF